MGQLYMQRFEYRGAVNKAEFDAAWNAAHEVMATTGNWGGAKTGIKHIHGYGTSWGGYGLIEVEDPQALVEYQMFHVSNYSHMVQITFDPLVDLDEALASMYAEIRGKKR